MEQIILVVHLLVALGIIGLIMMQQGKGADIGASFGAGGSQTLFGSVGSANLLTKLTAWLVAAFFASSFGLAMIADSRTAGDDDLGFELPMEAIISDKTTRKYVDKFDASYHITIDKEGNPVESEMSFKGRGRAYIVLSVKAELSAKSTYQVYGERLLQLTNEYEGTFKSSLWPDSRYSGGHELTVLENDKMLSLQR